MLVLIDGLVNMSGLGQSIVIMGVGSNFEVEGPFPVTPITTYRSQFHEVV